MNELAKELAGRYGARGWHDIRKDLASVEVDAIRIRDVMAYLRDEAGYGHLSFMTAIDNIERGAFTLSYALRDHDARRGLIVHADVDRAEPTVDSIHLLWGQAWTYQREMREWFGIDFPGSPRVDEEFVLEGWEGPPMMRRDFDSLAYSDATYAERPGRVTHDPASHMREKLYPEAAQ
ncbi:MAG: NADH-quinone oxidoreductase subunit C [Spirochaetae bacterium HGW-Spirochaetae-3]|jgi:NADH-quinone oxidoreductase subunit C|nr:MAG: NADH-quinone oxidoreductase subunit C [Spirochaetae bacterium HGW-Spirochaetae-3]